MKIYTVHLNYYATADVDVLAESEEEAIRKAENADLELSDFDFSHNESSVIWKQDVDLKDLEEKAKNILKEYDPDYECLSFELEPWPTIHMQCFDGEWSMKRYTICNLYLNPDIEEIAFLAGDVDDDVECGLIDVPDIDKYRICIAIIEQDKRNKLNNKTNK